MALTVIGGSSFIGRYLIKALSGSYKEVRLGDMYPYRQSVYRLQEDQGDKLKKYPLVYPTNLRYIMEGTGELIIVTHDYFKLAYSKNFYLEKAVQFAVEYGVPKITWVGPYELDQLNSWDGNPETLIEDAEASARKMFPELISLRTDLIFGANCTSLLIHKALEDLHSSKKAITGNNGHTKFAPVFEEDVLNALKNLKPGDKAVITGPEELKWDEIVKVLAEHCGVANPSHTSALDWLKGWFATCQYTGDILYPSHYQQLYRLLSKTREIKPTIKGSKTLAGFYEPGKSQTIPTLNWHRVILD